MRNCKKNERPLWLLNFIKEDEVKDSQGNYTGEKTIVYTRPKKINSNISGARGSSQSEVFGTDIRYDKTITFSFDQFKELKITENSVFFVDSKPIYDGINPLYDYRVEKIADTKNEVVIAITKVRRK